MVVKISFSFSLAGAGFSHCLMCWKCDLLCFFRGSWLCVFFSSLNGTFILRGKRSVLRWLKKYQFHFLWQACGIFTFADVSKMWMFILLFCGSCLSLFFFQRKIICLSEFQRDGFFCICYVPLFRFGGWGDNNILTAPIMLRFETSCGTHIYQKSQPRSLAILNLW